MYSSSVLAWLMLFLGIVKELKQIPRGRYRFSFCCHSASLFAIQSIHSVAKRIQIFLLLLVFALKAQCHQKWTAKRMYCWLESRQMWLFTLLSCLHYVCVRLIFFLYARTHLARAHSGHNSDHRIALDLPKKKLLSFVYFYCCLLEFRI